MIGAVHASIGAAVGSLFKRKSSAFLAGVVSHIVADALPHTDFPSKIEAPFLAGSLVAIAAWRGVDSPEFWGSLGAVVPDAEHGLMEVGLIKPEDEIFPTHIDYGKYHGHETGERWSQLIIAAVAILTVVTAQSCCHPELDSGSGTYEGDAESSSA